MLPRLLEVRADAEPRLRLDGLGEALGLPVEHGEGQVQHRHLHAAGDIDADGVGDDGVAGGEDAADGQAVAPVRVGHEGAAHGHGQLARVDELLHRLGLEISAPLAERRVVGAGLVARPGVLSRQQKVRERSEIGIVAMRGGVGRQRPHSFPDGLDGHAPPPRGADELHGQTDRLARRDADVSQFLGFHGRSAGAIGSPVTSMRH